MSKVNPFLMCDAYKKFHAEQYPEGTEYVYSTWIPRMSRIPNVKEVTFFGLQGFVKKYLVEYFNESFFSRTKSEVMEEHDRITKNVFGADVMSKRIADLHDIGYLPIEIRALPEGTSSPIRVPQMTIVNTDPRFFWLTNFLETLISCSLWQPSTSATIAREYRRILDSWAEQTVGDTSFVKFQGHDFSMRGMSSLESAEVSGAGHLLSFVGTDTIPAICYLEDYYGADVSRELVGCSVPATEHSVQCASGKDNEHETYRRLIEDVYPSGIVSIVSDTWDLWHVLTEIIPSLKESIEKRDGKVVIRPDSGDPVDIICGHEFRMFDSVDEACAEYRRVNSDSPMIPCWRIRVQDDFYELEGAKSGFSHELNHTILRPLNDRPEYFGVIELLWKIFRGSLTEKWYKQLAPCIGAIYGDSITLERAESICRRLAAKGFASTNVVFGIGSFTYQYNTRDTFGYAMKATHCVIDGAEHSIFKDPVTDNGVKKSLTGMVVVKRDAGGKLYVVDGLSLEEWRDQREQDELKLVFRDGSLMKNQTLGEIRSRVSHGR